MTSTTFFIIFIPILAILLLAINLLLAPHNPYQEKDSAFECGFHSFLGQNRTQFSVSFFIFGLLFLLFDLEILLVYPYSVSSYTNDIYGLVIMMVFFVLLTLGFIFELGKNALTIDSRQTFLYEKEEVVTQHVFVSVSNVLYMLSTQYEHWATRIPSGGRMGTNRTTAEIAQQVNDLHATSIGMRDRIIERANTELAQPGIAEQIKNEITSIIVSANSTSDTVTVYIAESARLALEFAI